MERARAAGASAFYVREVASLSVRNAMWKGKTVGERASLRPKRNVERENGRREGFSPPERFCGKGKR